MSGRTATKELITYTLVCHDDELHIFFFQKELEKKKQNDFKVLKTVYFGGIIDKQNKE